MDGVMSWDALFGNADIINYLYQAGAETIMG